MTGLARDAIEDLVGLLSSQIELVRAELHQDARAAMRGGLQLLIYVPLLIVGYCLLIATAGYGLSHLIGVWPTLLGLGVLHAAVGTFGLVRASRQLAAVHFFDRSGAALSSSVDQVSQAIGQPSGETAALVPPRPSLSSGR
jgi:hypothetical protein